MPTRRAPSSDSVDTARRRSRGGVVALALVGVALAGWSVGASPLFEVRRVRVEGNRRLSDAEVARLTGVRAGENILTLSTGRIERSIMRSPWVGSASVERSLPSTVVVLVRERTPVAWVKDPSGFVILAGDGTVLDRRPTEPRSLVGLGRSRTALRPGSRAADLGPSLSVAGSLPPALRREVASIRAVGGEIHLRLDGGAGVLYGRPDSLQEKNAALVEVLEWSAERGAELRRVDLRAPRSPAIRTSVP